jgi:Domain of unknown function (DUF1992)
VTERKPPGVSFESWIDKKIREAADRGEFNDLPGAGKPIPDLDKPYDDAWWIKEKLRRDNLSYLPPAAALRKKAEEALAEASQAKSERQVREIVTALNEKILEAIRKPPSGPPVDMVPFDVERVVRDWRERRSG